MSSPDESADFEEFYSANFRLVAGASRALTGRDDAFDIAQEAFVRTLERWSRVRQFERPVSYTLKIACNLSRSHHRRQAAQRRALSLLRAASRAHEVDESGLADLALQVQHSLLRLPRRQRQALVLCDLGGMTTTEAAASLGISSSTLRVHLSRARVAVAPALQGSVRQGESGVEGVGDSVKA